MMYSSNFFLIKKVSSLATRIIEPETVKLKENLKFETLLVQHMVDKKIKELCSIQIPLVRVNLNEATGNTTSEEKMK